MQLFKWTAYCSFQKVKGTDKQIPPVISVRYASPTNIKELLILILSSVQNYKEEK